MKSKYWIYAGTMLLCITMLACKKNSLLDQAPPTQLTDADYWHTSSDLQLYMNSIYNDGNIFNKCSGFAGPHVFYSFKDDGLYPYGGVSDDLPTSAYSQRLNGELTVNNGAYTGQGWGTIRNLNYFFANYGRVTDAWTSVSPFVGEAHFFRAMLYFNAVINVGGVPWVNKPLSTNDSAFLYAPRLPRNVVMDSIISDLDSAIADLPTKTSAQKLRLYKEYAQAFKARVCLYEGTWEKYHANDPFGVPGQDGTKYLQLAASAADDVMASGLFALDNVGQYDGYFSLFNQFDYSGSQEVIFWGGFNAQAGIYNVWQNIYQQGSAGSGGWGLSKTLVDDYLCTDGNPISVSALYKGDDSMSHYMANRDPRLRQTIYVYGDTVVTQIPGGPDLLFSYPALSVGAGSSSITGFQLKKGLNTNWNQYSGNGLGSTVAAIFMRYAEVLLIDAEAKAELGTISQADVDATINQIRDRVGMPHLQMGSITPDPNWAFPSLSPIINEIRRERHVELVCEGVRFNDICRWAAAPQLIVGKQPLGVKINQFLTVMTPAIVLGNNVNVNGQGYVQPYKTVPSLNAGYKFNINRDYLLPIDQSELTVNKNMTQNPGW